LTKSSLPPQSEQNMQNIHFTKNRLHWPDQRWTGSEKSTMYCCPQGQSHELSSQCNYLNNEPTSLPFRTMHTDDTGTAYLCEDSRPHHNFPGSQSHQLDAKTTESSDCNYPSIADLVRLQLELPVVSVPEPWL